MPPKGKITHKQELAITALLTTKTISEAAASVGINSRTLERWLAGDEAFTREYRATRRRVLEGAIGQLQHASGEAVETLQKNLTCGKPTVEVRAAVAILDQAIKAVELYDLEERLSALEQREGS